MEHRHRNPIAPNYKQISNSNIKAGLEFWHMYLGTVATCPLYPQETLSQSVIPAKSRKAGREPGSRKKLANNSGSRPPNSGMIGETCFQGERRFSRSQVNFEFWSLLFV